MGYAKYRFLSVTAKFRSSQTTNTSGLIAMCFCHSSLEDPVGYKEVSNAGEAVTGQLYHDLTLRMQSTALPPWRFIVSESDFKKLYDSQVLTDKLALDTVAPDSVVCVTSSDSYRVGYVELTYTVELAQPIQNDSKILYTARGEGGTSE